MRYSHGIAKSLIVVIAAIMLTSIGSSQVQVRITPERHPRPHVYRPYHHPRHPDHVRFQVRERRHEDRNQAVHPVRPVQREHPRLVEEPRDGRR